MTLQPISEPGGISSAPRNREPYVGPRPFTRDDQKLFFGRDREAADLFSLIIAHPVVLLYSQSGAGKSSMLNAKIIPMLEDRGSQILGPVRVGVEPITSSESPA